MNQQRGKTMGQSNCIKIPSQDNKFESNRSIDVNNPINSNNESSLPQLGRRESKAIEKLEKDIRKNIKY